MKSYHDQRGNLVRGTSILEDILQSQSKTMKLVEALSHFGLKIFPGADPRHKNIDWIVPEEL